MLRELMSRAKWDVVSRYLARVCLRFRVVVSWVILGPVSDGDARRHQADAGAA